jgi:outer membrane protein assembly factor BamE
MIARHYHAGSAPRPPRIVQDTAMTHRFSYVPALLARLLIGGALALTLLLSACVHRVAIPQGNFLKKGDVDKVAVGMTRVQVRAVLGTPMIADPFETQRWDYVFYIKQGDRYTYKQQHVIVYFDSADKVERIDRPQHDDESPLPKVEDLPPVKTASE